MLYRLGAAFNKQEKIMGGEIVEALLNVAREDLPIMTLCLCQFVSAWRNSGSGNDKS